MRWSASAASCKINVFFLWDIKHSDPSQFIISAFLPLCIFFFRLTFSLCINLNFSLTSGHSRVAELYCISVLARNNSLILLNCVEEKYWKSFFLKDANFSLSLRHGRYPAETWLSWGELKRSIDNSLSYCRFVPFSTQLIMAEPIYPELFSYHCHEEFANEATAQSLVSAN